MDLLNRQFDRSAGPKIALNWRVLGLLNLYRVLVPLVLLGLYSLGGSRGIAVDSPELFFAVAIFYLCFGLCNVVLVRRRLATAHIQTILQATVDLASLMLLLHACGGITGGLGLLLLVPVGGLAFLLPPRSALFLAALAALAVLAHTIWQQLSGHADITAYAAAGFLGLVLFTIAGSASVVASRMRESEDLVRQKDVDLANLADLSQYIVQHLRESILVLDAQDRIRLINESAAQILGDEHAFPGALIGEASPRLLYLLESWRKDTTTAARNVREQTFVAADGARLIRAHFAPLAQNPGPVLIFLEDTSLMEEKVQQSKLAALGRLSASIAHEIRNPVGAMSHAAQLLGESPHVSAEDQRLTQIIRSNGERVSGIIENVQRLSRREETHLERLPLAAWTQEFRQEFCETMQWPTTRLQLTSSNPEVEVRVDPDQLRQIVWNLCENALKHAIGEASDLSVELRYGRMLVNDRPFLEVADRGPGVASEHAERMFEPFYSGGGGTGLGLFLARELAQTNGATLLYEARPGGGSIFRLVFADPRRWER